MKKKTLVIAVLLLVAASFAAGVYAQKTYTIKLNDKTLKLKTNEINGKIWVPFEETCAALGIQYKADAEKGVINLKAPAVFQVPPRFQDPADRKLKERYYFKLTYYGSGFQMDVYVNDELIGSYKGDADVEITEHLKKGENRIKVVYNFAGKRSGFYFAVQQLSKEKKDERVILKEMDRIYAPSSSSSRTGEREFIIDAQ